MLANYNFSDAVCCCNLDDLSDGDIVVVAAIAGDNEDLAGLRTVEDGENGLNEVL